MPPWLYGGRKVRVGRDRNNSGGLPKGARRLLRRGNVAWKDDGDEPKIMRSQNKDQSRACAESDQAQRSVGQISVFVDQDAPRNTALLTQSAHEQRTVRRSAQYAD
jgi:hypothetical protein